MSDLVAIVAHAELRANSVLSKTMRPKLSYIRPQL
jgi:hypothetical protein